MFFMATKKNRHPTEKSSRKPTPTPPIISCGKRDREVMTYLNSNNNKPLNIKQYSREKSIPRSSVYEIILRLSRKGLMIKEQFNNRLSDKGINYIESLNLSQKEGVGSLRQECREINKLSTHWHKFRLPIKDKTKLRTEALHKLNYKLIAENKLLNLHQTIMTFDDAKIIINPKQVIISIFDTVTDNVEDSDLKSLHRALEYAQRLNEIGLVTHGMMVEEGHWARIESPLADWLYKNVDGKYYLELSNGSKFWIDCSGGHKAEDETNDKEVRERIDNSLNLLGMGEVDLNDINSLKEVSSNLLKLEAMKITKGLELQSKNKLEFREDNIKIQNYIG